MSDKTWDGEISTCTRRGEPHFRWWAGRWPFYRKIRSDRSVDKQRADLLIELRASNGRPGKQKAEAVKAEKKRKAENLKVGEILTRFIAAKDRLLASGELGGRTHAEYKATTCLVLTAFGENKRASDLEPDDFASLRAEMAKRWGPVRLGNEIQRVRTVFRYAYDHGLIDRPVRFGAEFKKPSKKVLRVHRADRGKRLFTAAEIQTLLATDHVQIRAMILLGVNAALGNEDLASLPMTALDLDGGWVDFPRPKTGIERRCPLWPETVKALRAVLDSRPQPKDTADANLVFITKYGHRWIQGGLKTRIDSVQLLFCRLLRDRELYQAGRGFYALRHTFRTVADATKDFPAVRRIMGHTDNSIDAVYREHIEDARLRAVVDHVRGWLFGQAGEPDGSSEPV